MTKPVSRKLAVDCLLWMVQQPNGLATIPLGEHLADGFFYTFRCYICGEPILPGQAIQFDHLHADIHGGPHEYQNLRPVHYDPCHKKKSGRDVAANAKVKRIRGETCTRPGKKIAARKNPWPPRGSRKMQSRGFEKRGRG